MMGGAVMSQVTQEDALRQADALVVEALKGAEARCAVLGHYINDCDSKGSRTAAWSDALRELSAVQRRRAGLLRRHSLIQEALDCPVGESVTTVPLPPPPDQGALRTQHQVQIRPHRRRS
jgi:hypothetical protein